MAAPAMLMLLAGGGSGPVTYTDDFNRASIGSAWTTGGSSNWDISSNRLRKTAVADSGVIDFNTALPVNMFAEIDYVSGAPNINPLVSGLHLRAASPGDDTTGFFAGWSLFGTDGWYICAGTRNPATSFLVTAAQATRPTGKRIRFEAVGTTLNLYEDGVLKLSTTSASYSTNTYSGICCGSSGTVAVLMDNFACGSM